MICKICQSNTTKIFSKKILNKYQVDYFQCSNCDFIQTEEPSWLEESYKETINTCDTGLLARNIHLSKVTTLIIFFYFKIKGKFLDFAGGYGVFTRLMRDISFDFLWHDPFTINLFAKGFEWSLNNSPKIELLTSFESFEHFVEPIKELEKMITISDNILFSTELIPSNNIEGWTYLGIEHGQHISFYSKKTLTVLAEKYNLNLYTNRKSLHLFTKKKKYISINLIHIFSKLQLDLFIKHILKSKTVSDSNFIKK